MKKILTTAICILLFLNAFPLFAAADDPGETTLLVGVSGGMEPLLFYGGEGQIIGAFADMMDYISEQNGFSVRYLKFQQPVESLTALANGEIDVALGIFSSKADGYPSIEMSRELYGASLCMASENVQTYLDTGSFGAFEMDTVPHHLQEIMDVSQYLIFPNQDLVLDALLTGRSTRILGLRDCIQYKISNLGLENVYTVSNVNVGYLSYGIALDKTDLILNSKINTSISSLRSDSRYDSILKRWDLQTEIEAANLRTARLIKIIAGIAVAAAFIVLLFILINTRLRSMVKAQTAELSERVEDLNLAGSLRNTLIERSSAGSMVLRLDGTILLMNEAMRRMADCPVDAQIENISELGFINEIWGAAPPEMDQPELCTRLGADGLLHTFRYQNHRAVNHDERVFIIEDITREEAEKQAVFEEDKNRALNRIIAGLAHEIKNPLTTLRAYAYLAETPDEDPQFYESFSKYVPGEINRISSLVESLVNYSRPVRGQKQRTRVADISDSCLGLAYLTSKNKIRIENEIDRELFVEVNGDQLRQALVNLLLNSIESAEEAKADGKEDCLIRHAVYRRGGQVVIEVYDTGLGMSEEQLRSCTDPFFTTKKSGTGMGLAIAKQYVKENDGTLEIESAEGEYTAIRMVFAEDKENG